MKTKIKKLYSDIALLLFFLFSPLMGNARNDSNKCDDCIKIVKKISKKWKTDSLAGNGYRLAVYEHLKKCKLNNLKVSFLLEELGPPTRIDQEPFKTIYRYNYYDYKYIDTATSKWKVYGWDFLNFSTDSSGEKIEKIGMGTGEY